MGGTRIILAGRFIDGSGAKVRRKIFLAVENGTITAIGSAADLPRNHGAVIVDLTHCTILPALVDCSMSLSQSPSVDRLSTLSLEKAGFTEKASMIERHIRYCHAHGVLGVADGDDPEGLVTHFLGEITEGIPLDLKTSGRLCRSRPDVATGHPAEGDFLKIGYSRSIDDRECPPLQLNYEDLCRILQHRDGKKAVVIANGARQVEEALAAGCDAIEQGYRMGEDNLRNMAKKNVLWIPSVLRAKNALDGAGSGGDVCCRFSQRYVAPGKPDPGAEVHWKKMLAEQLAQLRFARKLGIPTAVGTGAGGIGILHGESMVEEMKLFMKAGYSLEETVRCASETGARFFGMERLGSLTVGRKATFLITRGMVKQLPRKLSYLEGIYIDGQPSATYQKNPVKAA